MKYAANLGENQRHVLKNLRDMDGGRGWSPLSPWGFGTNSVMIKILDALVERRYAHFMPYGRFVITDAGRAALVMPTDRAGLLDWVPNEITGSYVGVYDGIGPKGEENYDTAGGRWQTICELHSNIISHPKLDDALWYARHPVDFCDRCSGAEEFDPEDVAKDVPVFRTKPEPVISQGAEVPENIKELALTGKTIAAIKQWRELVPGLTLKDAYNAIRAIPGVQEAGVRRDADREEHVVRTDFVLQYSHGGTPPDWIDGGGPFKIEGAARTHLEWIGSEAKRESELPEGMRTLFTWPWRLIERVTTERVIG